MYLEAESMIHPSITESAFTAGLDESILELPPHELIAAAKRFFTSTITSGHQEALRRESFEIKIERDETIDEYIKRHKEHRCRMIRFQVPGVADEASYVTTIIHGLSTRPSLQSQISSLQMMQFPTISALHLQLKQTAAIQDSLWSQRNRGRRGGRRGR